MHTDSIGQPITIGDTVICFMYNRPEIITIEHLTNKCIKRKIYNKWYYISLFKVIKLTEEQQKYAMLKLIKN